MAHYSDHHNLTFIWFSFVVLPWLCHSQELISFWNLTAAKTWTSRLIPRENGLEWRLGLGGFTSVMHKGADSLLNMTDFSNVTLASFSLLSINSNSIIHLGTRATIDLRERSELLAHESSSLQLADYSSITAKSSSFLPGFLRLNKSAAIILNDGNLKSQLSKISLDDNSQLRLTRRSQVVLIAGSSITLGKNSQLRLVTSNVDFAGSLSIGPRSVTALKGADLAIVGGNLILGENVDFKADSRSTVTIFGGSLKFTDGSKITLETQSEFIVERNASIIMARRDLRLKVEDKSSLTVKHSSYCMMTDDLLVPRQTTVELASSALVSSPVRCFPTERQLLEEKQRLYPEK